MKPIQVGVWLSLARALRSGRRGRRFKSSHPDHFFVLCNPVLYDWIFLYLDFTHRTTSIYSKSSPKQRTNRERQILCFPVCFE